MRETIWTGERIAKVVEHLRATPRNRYAEALAMIGEDVGLHITADAIKAAFLARGLGPPTSFCGPPSYAATILPPPTMPPARDVSETAPCTDAEPISAHAIVDIVRRRPLPLFDVCEKLDATPAQLRAAIDEAKVSGFLVDVFDGHVALVKEPPRAAGPLDFGRHGPGRRKVGVFSDVHFGSAFCEAEELSRWFEWAYAEGVRTFLCAGDILDGFKDVLIPEQRAVGFERQANEALRHVPRLDGAIILAIGGNHDGYFSTHVGLEPGRALEQAFRADDRDDWRHVGNALADIRVEGASFTLWHPHGGTSKNAGVVNVIESKIITKLQEESPTRSDFVLSGHLHKFVAFHNSTSLGVGCGTWQRKGSTFSNRIAGPWAVGGVILEYQVGDDGSVYDKGARFTSVSRFKSRAAA